MVPEQRLKPLCKQAGPGTHCDPEFAFLLQYQLKHRISSVGRDPKGSTSSSSWACTRQSQKSHHVSERIVQALLISGRCCDQAVRKALRNTRQQVVNGHQNRFSCLFYLSQVLLAQGSARRCIWQTPLCSQATSCQTPSYPLQSTDSWIPTYPLHFRQQRRCSQSFCGIAHFSWKGRGLEALPKPWDAGFWILALSP